jgi:hypothetical protein
MSVQVAAELLRSARRNPEPAQRVLLAVAASAPEGLEKLLEAAAQLVGGRDGAHATSVAARAEAADDDAPAAALAADGLVATTLKAVAMPATTVAADAGTPEATAAPDAADTAVAATAGAAAAQGLRALLPPHVVAAPAVAYVLTDRMLLQRTLPAAALSAMLDIACGVRIRGSTM